MADVFQKLKTSVNRGITTISVKTSSTFEKSTINTHIDTLKNEIAKLNSKLGEDVYNAWISGEESIGVFSETLEQIKAKLAEIDALNDELKKIDERSNSVLGTDKNSDANTPHFCTNCGTRYEVGAKFCRKCGNSLQES